MGNLKLNRFEGGELVMAEVAPTAVMTAEEEEAALVAAFVPEADVMDWAEAVTLAHLRADGKEVLPTLDEVNKLFQRAAELSVASGDGGLIPVTA